MDYQVTLEEAGSCAPMPPFTVRDSADTQPDLSKRLRSRRPGTGSVCACNSVRNARFLAASSSGGAVKGNPCDILSGRKQQSEADYRANGDFPLTFREGYNSGRVVDSSSIPVQNPIGIGWMATYLQYLVYAESPTFSGLYAYRPDGGVVAFAKAAEASLLMPKGAIASNGSMSSGQKVGFSTSRQTIRLSDTNLDGLLQSVTSRSGHRAYA